MAQQWFLTFLAAKQAVKETSLSPKLCFTKIDLRAIVLRSCNVIIKRTSKKKITFQFLILSVHHSLATNLVKFHSESSKNCNEVDRIGEKLETDKNDYVCNPYDMPSEKCSNMSRFDTFKHASKEDLLQVASKCPNKFCRLNILPTWLLK